MAIQELIKSNKKYNIMKSEIKGKTNYIDFICKCGGTIKTLKRNIKGNSLVCPYCSRFFELPFMITKKNKFKE